MVEGDDAGECLDHLRNRFDALMSAQAWLPEMLLLVKLVVDSRSGRSTVDSFQESIPDEYRHTFRRILQCLEDQPLLGQGALTGPQHSRWRAYDSAGNFTDIARMFFAIHLEELLHQMAADGAFRLREDRVAVFAKDLTQILVAFSARWFSTCVREQTPSPGVVRWYLRHCAGKIDLELEREINPDALLPRRPNHSPAQLTLTL